MASVPGVVTVSCAEPAPPATVEGSSDQLTSWGSPLTVRDTSPAKPLNAVDESVYETAPPAVVLADDGVTSRPKSGVAVVL